MASTKRKSMNNARKEKNDEFYTKLEDIEKELQNYESAFNNKIVYCNADDPRYSQFTKYFSDNFKRLKLKELISTGYNASGRGIINTQTLNSSITRFLTSNGSYDSEECMEQLKRCDIVVTNPPFSLFRYFLKEIADVNKQFIVVGPIFAVSQKMTIDMIINSYTRLGYNIIHKFNNNDKSFGNSIFWFTNTGKHKQNKPVPLSDTMIEYYTYNNYDAINVDRVKDIPKDYYGIIGVPVSYITKHCEDQFSIVGGLKGTDGKNLNYTLGDGTIKEPFTRLLIKRK